VPPHYGELLDLFVRAIREMPKLDESKDDVSFATALDAFRHDWAKEFPAGGPTNGAAAAPGAAPAAAIAPPVAAVQAPAPARPPLTPSPLTSLVAFYVTARPFTQDGAGVYFADQLIREPQPGVEANTDPELATLLSDVRAAAVAERFSVFHAAATPAVPNDPEPLIARLEALSRSGILVALVVDPQIWPAGGAAFSAVIGTIVRSSRWVGRVLVPESGPASVAGAVSGLPAELSARVVVLPRDSAARQELLHRIFIATRGDVLSSLGGPTGGGQLPLLKVSKQPPN
jgi:hypothetical protein